MAPWLHEGKTCVEEVASYEEGVNGSGGWENTTYEVQAKLFLLEGRASGGPGHYRSVKGERLKFFQREGA